MSTIEEMLDTLSGYQYQAGQIENEKRALLDAVKIPAEVQAIHDAGARLKAEADSAYLVAQRAIDAQAAADMDAVQYPPEVAEILREITAKREAIREEAKRKEREAWEKSQAKKAQVDAEFEASIAHVYAEIENRKAEIAAEYNGRLEAAMKNMAALEDEIKRAVVQIGKTVKGTFLQAVFMKGRITWNTDMLDGMIIAFPELAKARKEGAPSVSLRAVGK